MDRSDILVQVRGRELDGSGHPLGRRGTITARYLSLEETTLRWSNVGQWKITLPGGHPMVPYLTMDGSGIVVSLRGEPWFSGPTIQPGRDRGQKNPDGSWTFVGVTDEQHLADALAAPSPAVGDLTAQTQTNDVRTGPVETLMYEYVGANIGPTAPAARRDGLRQYITLGTDLGRGVTAQKSPRFQNLLELLQELAVLDTGMGFRLVQIGTALVFDVVPTRDRRDTVRLDIQNGTLTSEQVRRTGPNITRAIVAGQGEGIDRVIVARTTADATAAEDTWGRVIERFIDQRQATDPLELEQAGDEALNEGGYTATSVKVIPADDTTMRYGMGDDEWREGDRVTVVVDGQETDSVVTAAAVIVNREACKVGAAIGDVVGFDKEAALTARVEDIDRRVGNLERSEAAEPDDTPPAWADITGKPATFPPSAHTHVGADVDAATDAARGTVELATTAEATTGTDTTRAVTPAGLKAAEDARGYTLRQIVTFTSSGTFSKATYPWLRAIRAVVIGGGGAGGGLASATTNLGRGGGGAGGMCERFITNIAGLSASETVTIGAGAAGVAGNGSAGGATTALGCTAGGGGGGSAGVGAAGSASGGDLNIDGQAGQNGSSTMGTAATVAVGGNGGSTRYGSGGPGAVSSGAGVAGGAATGYGAGGGGVARHNSGAPVGGNGAGGIVILELFA